MLNDDSVTWRASNEDNYKNELLKASFLFPLYAMAHRKKQASAQIAQEMIKSR